MATCFCFKPAKPHKKTKTRPLRRSSLRLTEIPRGVRADASTQESVYSLAKTGNAASLQRLIDRLTEEELYKQLEWKDDHKRTPLIIAARKSHADCMQLLIDNGADVEYMTNNVDEGSALHVAVRKRLPTRVIYALLSKGANPFIENNFHITAWDVGRQCTNWTAISIFSDLGLFRRRLPVQFGGGNGLTCTGDVCIIPRYEQNPLTGKLRRVGRTLHICSMGQSEEHSDIDLTGAQAEWITEDTPDIASILLTFPATNARLAKSISVHIKRTSCIMHIWIPRWASWSLEDFFEIVNEKDETSVGRRFRGDFPDIDARVLSWIRQQTASQCLEDVESFCGKRYLPDEAFKQSQKGDHIALRLLLGTLLGFEKVHALSWEDVNGDTPLSVAVKNNHIKCVKLLLEHGANVHHCSQAGDGGTALHAAIGSNASDEIIETLLSYQANPLVENSNRVTAADLSGGDKNLMAREDMLFQEVMKGSISLKGRSGSLGCNTAFFLLIAPRYARCDRPQDLRRISKTLHIYQAEHDEPLVEIDLYEAKAEMEAQKNQDRRDVLLCFPTSSILTWNWRGCRRPDHEQVAQFVMSFESSVDICSRLVKIVNIQDGLHIAASVKSIWNESRRMKSSVISAPIAATLSQHRSQPSLSTDIWEDNASDSVEQIHSGIREQINTLEQGYAECTFCFRDAGPVGIVWEDRLHVHAQKCAIENVRGMHR